MNFRRNARHDEPEINLVPFIDVLLVILIFLMITTTYAKYSELKITLPTADAERPAETPKEVVVVVSADGRYAVNRHVLNGRDIGTLTAEISRASGGDANVPVIISADASTTHQSVINVMEAARRAGLVRLTFATQQPGK
ncbi:MAG: biopolymer transporter ExbD [Betaproteobacteria bacterium]|nr:biopolymer transporter ExbD [Betaproteobacteria bacterium]